MKAWHFLEVSMGLTIVLVAHQNVRCQQANDLVAGESNAKPARAPGPRSAALTSPLTSSLFGSAI
jgi:hypothetical protein